MEDKVKAKIVELVPTIGHWELKSGERLVVSDPTITLAVVLRAIGKSTKYTSYFVDSDGSFHEWFAPKGRLDLRTVAQWNLEHDNYDQQSEEFKRFLGTLL